MIAIPLDRPRPTPARPMRPASHDYSGLDDHALLARLLRSSDRPQRSVVGALMARFGSIAETVAAARGELVPDPGLDLLRRALPRLAPSSSLSLPPADPQREERQIERLRQLARDAKLDPDFTEKFLRFIIDEVIRHHQQIRDAG